MPTASISLVRTTLHSRLSHFVAWIEADASRVEEIREQRDRVRQRISGQAKDDGLQIVSTPDSGSFAKATGLRRHFRGDCEVEGQDVDVPFVVKPVTTDDEKLDQLLPRFERYARDSFPTTEIEPTKSSIRLSFDGTKLQYDLVPLLEVPGVPDEQILIRSTGERRRTSLKKHNSFVVDRTRRSNEIAGAVCFNEVVRLLKWWREIRVADGQGLEDVPSVLIDLLCAYAFDQRGVAKTYGETLADWFGFLASAVRRRQRIVFSDFTRNVPAPVAGVAWEVLDPANMDNNIVNAWSTLQIDVLAEWLADGRDSLNRAIGRDLDGDDSAALDALVEVFGTPIIHHSEEES